MEEEGWGLLWHAVDPFLFHHACVCPSERGFASLCLFLYLRDAVTTRLEKKDGSQLTGRRRRKLASHCSLLTSDHRNATPPSPPRSRPGGVCVLRWPAKCRNVPNVPLHCSFMYAFCLAKDHTNEGCVLIRGSPSGFLVCKRLYNCSRWSSRGY